MSSQSLDFADVLSPGGPGGVRLDTDDFKPTYAHTGSNEDAGYGLHVEESGTLHQYRANDDIEALKALGLSLGSGTTGGQHNRRHHHHHNHSNSLGDGNGNDFKNQRNRNSVDMKENNQSPSASHISHVSQSFSQSASASHANTTNVEDYVKYLLAGSGAEDSVDYARLRTELELGLDDASENSHSTATRSVLQPSNAANSATNNLLSTPISHQKTSVFTKESTPTPTRSFKHQQGPTSPSTQFTPNPLNHISTLLVSSGFPPLNPSLFSNLAGPQSTALAELLALLLKEYSKRGELIQHMISERTDCETQISRLSTELASKDDRITSLLNSHSQTQTQSQSSSDSVVNSLKSQTRLLVHELDDARALMARAQHEKDSLQKRVMVAETLADQTKDELNNLMFQHQKSQVQSERTLALLKSGNPRSSAVDKIILEVIAAYEQKMKGLEVELGSLMEETRIRNLEVAKLKRENGPESPKNQLRAGVVEDVDLEWVNEAKVGRVMGQQVKELATQLEEAQSKLLEAQESQELLKLQLLAHKKPTWPDKIQSIPKQRYSTRDMIRRDRISHKLNLSKIEKLSVEDAQQVLKEICIMLDLGDVDDVLVGLENVEKVLRLLPQMQSFITNVDAVIWGWKDRLFPPGTENIGLVPPRKLGESIKALEEWSEIVKRAESFKIFRSRVHESLGLYETGESDKACLGLLRRAIKGEDAKSERHTDVQKLVNYIQDLFDVESLDQMYSKMNDVYVFYTETVTGVKRLAKILDFDESTDAGKVLLKSADLLANSILNSEQSRTLKPNTTAILLAPALKDREVTVERFENKRDTNADHRLPRDDEIRIISSASDDMDLDLEMKLDLGMEMDMIPALDADSDLIADVAEVGGLDGVEISESLEQLMQRLPGIRKSELEETVRLEMDARISQPSSRIPSNLGPARSSHPISSFPSSSSSNAQSGVETGAEDKKSIKSPLVMNLENLLGRVRSIGTNGSPASSASSNVDQTTIPQTQSKTFGGPRTGTDSF